MRRITLWLLSTVTVVVLLFSYRTSTSSATSATVAAGPLSAGSLPANGSADAGTGAADTTPSATPSDTTTSSGSTATPTPSASSSTSFSSRAAKSYTGDAVMTRYGPVQVEITVASGKVTKSVVTQVPWNDRRDQEINAYAVPVLNTEAVQAQSAQIDMVSGATFTSDGYIQSLQSALDQAHL